MRNPESFISNEAEVHEPAVEEEKIDDSRRGFLRFAAGTAALLTLEGCASRLASPTMIERAAELADRREPFAKRWGIVLEDGLAEFSGNEESQKAFGPETAKELTEAVKSFDVEDYVAALATISGMRPDEIGGEIATFRIVPDGKGAMGAVKDYRNLQIYGGEWLKYQGKVHEPSVHAVMRHELAHIFSLDPSRPLGENAPLVYEPQTRGWTERAHLNGQLYEGLTEVVSQAAGLAKGGAQTLEQGYRGGATLSAFVLGELVGRKSLFEAYLRRDTKLLKRALDKGKVDEGLLFPLDIRLFSQGDASLDFLHRAFISGQVDRHKVNAAVERARQEGIDERVEHRMVEDISTTTHLFKINDADDPSRYLLNGIACSPRVFRFSRKQSKFGGEPTERFNLKMGDFRLNEEEKEKMLANTAANFKQGCGIENPDTFNSGDAICYLGYDGYISDRLWALQVSEDKPEEFEKIWREISTHATEMFASAAREIFKRAGVSKDLVVGPAKY